MDKEQIELFQKEFFYQIDKKSSHGQNQIKQLFIIAMNNVFLNNTEFNEQPKKI